MTTSKKVFRFLTLMIPVGLFIASLTQNAFTTEYMNEEGPTRAIDIFIMGPTLIAGGALNEWLTWMANPLALVAAYRFFVSTSEKPLLKKYEKFRSSILLSLLASAIAWTFSFWDEVLGNEGGTMSPIVSFDPGYWLWASSFYALAIGILVFAAIYKYPKKEKNLPFSK
nr:hypothetical protein [uncultured Mucilaginibacter sp.]